MSLLFAFLFGVLFTIGAAFVFSAYSFDLLARVAMGNTSYLASYIAGLLRGLEIQAGRSHLHLPENGPVEAINIPLGRIAMALEDFARSPYSKGPP